MGAQHRLPRADSAAGGAWLTFPWLKPGDAWFGQPGQPSTSQRPAGARLSPSVQVPVCPTILLGRMTRCSLGSQSPVLCRLRQPRLPDHERRVVIPVHEQPTVRTHMGPHRQGLLHQLPAARALLGGVHGCHREHRHLLYSPVVLHPGAEARPAGAGTGWRGWGCSVECGARRVAGGYVVCLARWRAA
jgi:hypothetical protein